MIGQTFIHYHLSVQKNLNLTGSRSNCYTRFYQSIIIDISQHKFSVNKPQKQSNKFSAMLRTEMKNYSVLPSKNVLDSIITVIVINNIRKGNVI